MFSSEWLLKLHNLDVLNELSQKQFTEVFSSIISTDESVKVFEYIDIHKKGVIPVHFLATLVDLWRAYKGKIGTFPFASNTSAQAIKNKTELNKLADKTVSVFDNYSSKINDPNKLLTFEEFVRIFGSGVKDALHQSIFRSLDVLRCNKVVFYHIMSAIDSFIDV